MMINKLKRLGEYVQHEESNNNPLNLKTNVLGAYVICLLFDYDGNECKYVGIDTIQEYTKSNMEKFMFVIPPSPRSTPLFPSWSIGGSIPISLDKIKKSFSNKCNLEIFADTIDFNNDEIVNNIQQSLDKDAPNHILTVQINGELIKGSKLFTDKIAEYEQNIEEVHYSMANGEIISKSNATCYFCNKEKLVYGFVNLNDFNFYSPDNLAFIAGGFQKKSTWKNYPVCPECIKPLQAGKYLIENHFSHIFWGNSYFILPTPILNGSEFSEFIEDMKEEYHQISLKRGDDDKSQQSKQLEEDILECLANHNDTATITFFFYHQDKKKFQILQEAEDILPSRFQKIIDAKKKVEDYDEFKNLKGLYKKGVSHNLSFNFGIIKTFFPSNFNNDFLDITTKILKDQKMSKTFITHQISEHLAKGFRNDALYHDIKKAMIFLKFLYDLNLIEQTKGKMEVKMKNKYEDYFQLHPEFYDADWKKAVFLTGALAQNVMDIQKFNRGAAPFRSRLNGLKLDQRIIKRLLPESIEKLEQYKSNYYRDLEEKIALLMESGEPVLKLQSVDEISFYFAMGMNLNNLLKNCKSCEKPHFQCQCKCKECDNTRVYCTCKKFKTEKKQNGANNE